MFVRSGGVWFGFAEKSVTYVLLWRFARRNPENMFVSEDDCHPSLNLHSFTNIGWSDQFVVFFHLNVSLYGRLFNESVRLYYLWKIFTAFAVGLSG